MSQSAGPRNDHLFLDRLQFGKTSLFSFPLLSTDVLKSVMRRKTVYVLGDSKEVLRRLDGAVTAIEAVAGSFHVTGFPLSPLPDAGPDRLARFLEQLHRLPAKDDCIFLLADKNYGPALSHLCARLREWHLVLLPSGYLVPGIPGARLGFEAPETAVVTMGNVCSWLDGKSVLVLNAGSQYRHLIKPLLDASGHDIRVAGIIDPEPSVWGNAIHGHEVYPPNRLAQGDYAAILTSAALGQSLYPLLHATARELTPLICLHPPSSGGASPAYAALTSGLFLQSPGMLGPREGAYNFKKEQYDLLFHDHPSRSDEHYEQLGRGFPSSLFHAGVCQPADAGLPALTVRHGLRRTVGNNERFDNAIYVAGASQAFGYYCDDAGTIQSRLQALCNAAYADKRLPVLFNVYNYGNLKGSLANFYRRLSSITLKKNDIVIFLSSDQEDVGLLALTRELCAGQGAHFAFFAHPTLFRMRNPSGYELELLTFYAHSLGIQGPDHWRAPARKAGGLPLQVKAPLANGIPAFDLQPCVERPHSRGEIFVDVCHVTYHGNECIADALLDEYILHICEADTNAARERTQRDLVETAANVSMTNASLIDWLDAVARPAAGPGERTGSIVMNCNPFSLGHKHIISQGLERFDRLYIFLVQEDQSFFSFEDRMRMLRAGTDGFGDRVCIVPSGDFIISSFTFPEYFSKDRIDHAPDLTTEILIFGTVIAPALNISARIFGEEPTCAVTRSYHEQLKTLLPLCGVEWVEIPRLQHGGRAVSASLIRGLLGEGRRVELAALVPPGTLHHLEHWKPE